MLLLQPIFKRARILQSESKIFNFNFTLLAEQAKKQAISVLNFHTLIEYDANMKRAELG
jgi:hypothetical protein